MYLDFIYRIVSYRIVSYRIVAKERFLGSNNKDLLTECEVCTGKYCLSFFVQTERRRSEVCAIKTEGNSLQCRPSKRG